MSDEVNGWTLAAVTSFVTWLLLVEKKKKEKDGGERFCSCPQDTAQAAMITKCTSVTL